MNGGLFIAGGLVTLIVVAAMGVLIWGLRMEARANAQREKHDRAARATAHRVAGE